MKNIYILLPILQSIISQVLTWLIFLCSPPLAVKFSSTPKVPKVHWYERESQSFPPFQDFFTESHTDRPSDRPTRREDGRTQRRARRRVSLTTIEEEGNCALFIQKIKNKETDWTDSIICLIYIFYYFFCHLNYLCVASFRPVWSALCWVWEPLTHFSGLYVC